MSDILKSIPRTFDEQEGVSVCATYDSLIDLIVLNSAGYDFEIKVGKKQKVFSGEKLLSKKFFGGTWETAFNYHSPSRITELAEIETWCYTNEVWQASDISLILKS
jgi:hypothetical protein